jgi:hypothetical protein
LAEPSIRHSGVRQRPPADDDTRSTAQVDKDDPPDDRPIDHTRRFDDQPGRDDVPENEPPIERADGQVYGG